MNYFNDISFDNFAYGRSAARRENSYFQGYYGIQFIYEGNIEVSIDGNPMERAAGPVIFFSFPDVMFTYGAPAGETRMQANVCFSGERVQNYIRTGLFPLRVKDVFLRPKAPYTTLKLMLELHDSLRLPDEYHRCHAVILLEELLLQIHCGSCENVRHSYIRDLRMLCDQIAASPDRNWNFKVQARQLSVSESHFRRIFRQITGLAPIQYLIECRITLAKQLLLTTGMRINEIGRMLHFDDEFHFSRIFKKKVGISPLQFRKQYL